MLSVCLAPRGARMAAFALGVTTAVASLPVVASDRVVIDQEDPAYQRMMEHLGAAERALRQAEQQLASAERFNVLAGFRVDRIRGEVNQIRDNIGLYIEPRKRELQYRRLAPDGVYFEPMGESRAPASTGTSWQEE